jgi:phosphoribosylanthranilate isomerase
MRVKICGITNWEDAEAAVMAGADALGFILYDKSKRYIPIEQALEIVEALPPFVQSVAVTVDATKEFSNLGWRKQLKHFDVTQLHGHESPVHARAVSKYLPVIKVFPALAPLIASLHTFHMLEHLIEMVEKFRRVQEELKAQLRRRDPTLDEIAQEMNLPLDQVVSIVELSDHPQFENHQRLKDYEPIASAFMLDTPSQHHGGTGKAFDWNLAVEFEKRTTKPLILSGGLNPENVAKAIELVHPYAVDVSSGVEASPGKKDHAKLRDFIEICKKF